MGSLVNSALIIVGQTVSAWQAFEPEAEDRILSATVQLGRKGGKLIKASAAV